MGVVHGLQGDSGVIAVEVAVLDEILDSVDNLDHVSVAWRVRIGHHVRASEDWPVPNVLPTLKKRSVDQFLVGRDMGVDSQLTLDN